MLTDIINKCSSYIFNKDKRKTKEDNDFNIDYWREYGIINKCKIDCYGSFKINEGWKMFFVININNEKILKSPIYTLLDTSFGSIDKYPICNFLENIGYRVLGFESLGESNVIEYNRYIIDNIEEKYDLR